MLALTTFALCTLMPSGLQAQSVSTSLPNNATQIASNPAQLLESIKSQLTSSGDSCNALYQFQENHKLVRIRIVMPINGMLNGSGLAMSLPKGAVALFHDGASPELIKAIKEIAEQTGHPAKMVLGGLINGKNPVDLFI